MHHLLAYLQGDIHTRVFRFCGEAGRVIQHGFIISDVDEQRGKPVKVTVKRRYVGQTGIVLSGVVFAANHGHSLRR